MRISKIFQKLEDTLEDPSVAEEADKWINRYRQYMPKKEDIFFRQITAGSRFRVPCWIQENTIVRTSD